MTQPNTPESQRLAELLAPLFDEIERRAFEGARKALEAHVSQLAEPSELSEWVDCRGAAAAMGCHFKTVTRLCADGVLPSSRVGNRIRVRRADIAAYLEGGRK